MMQVACRCWEWLKTLHLCFFGVHRKDHKEAFYCTVDAWVTFQHFYDKSLKRQITRCAEQKIRGPRRTSEKLPWCESCTAERLRENEVWMASSGSVIRELLGCRPVKFNKGLFFVFGLHMRCEKVSLQSRLRTATPQPKANIHKRLPKSESALGSPLHEIRLHFIITLWKVRHKVAPLTSSAQNKSDGEEWLMGRPHQQRQIQRQLHRNHSNPGGWRSPHRKCHHSQRSELYFSNITWEGCYTVTTVAPASSLRLYHNRDDI